MKIYPIILGQVETNAYVLSHEGRALLVDPAAEPQRILAYLNAQKLSVEGILLTHGHFDHIGAVNELAGRFKLPVYAHKKEQAYFEKPELNLSTMIYQNLRLQPELDFRFLEDGEVFEAIGQKIKALHVPGHTLGSLCFYFEDSEAVFTGDTLFNHSIGRTDFPLGNHRQLVTAIKTKLLTLPMGTIVYPGHNAATTIGDETRTNLHLQ
jgi:glyoxylase-like metal-dependent hydrolase (beta-lactamase superfamily II)